MKKIFIINLLLIILLNSFATCFAIESGAELIKYKGMCKPYLKYQGNIKLVHYASYEKSGKEFPAYCLNPEYSGVESAENKEYTVNVTQKIESEQIWKVIVNGYPYKSLEELGVANKEEAYTATQFAIYTVLHNRNTADYETLDESPEAKRTLAAYLKIMDSVKKSTENMNEKIEIISDSKIWEIDKNEIDYVSKIYTLNSNISKGNYILNLKGENVDKLRITDINGNEKNEFKIGDKFKILAPIDMLENDINIEVNAKVELITNPILYGKTTIPETQSYALTGNWVENFEISYKDIIPKNSSKIKIIKQEFETSKKLEGVKFNLLNSNKDSVIQALITDKNGEIILENLMPGVYYLQETETLENYNLNTELIEINLELNEEVEIVVENTIKEIKKEPELPRVEEKFPETPQEKIEIIPERTLPVTGC